MPATDEGTDRPPRFIVGTMTGTSIDGDIDAAIVSVHGHGLSLRAPVVACGSFALGPVADDLRRVANQQPMTAGELARIAHEFGVRHAEALAELCDSANVRPDLVVLHGQTVFHAPPFSWQLINPWPVAHRLRCAVRFDLRGANIAAGGQGAPITPLADFILFGHDTAPTTVLNLGGFANASLIQPRREGPRAVRGFDLCPCNHLLDRVARTRLGRPFDEDGRAASHGIVDASISAEIAARLRTVSSARDANRGPRSLGTGDEGVRAVDLSAELSPSDACATVVDALARVLGECLLAAGHTRGDAIVIAGGSARHRTLRESLAFHSGCPVETSEEHSGVPVAMREAVAMAVLGALADDGVPYTLPDVTGAESCAIDSARISVPRAR